ncbi:MAG TPA: hypothetical protein VFL13_13010 [Candidatus Baltobacteraceae bacterium]|nr:hypothetical protein [Candidatus Baltobacteraceae bacterium]
MFIFAAVLIRALALPPGFTVDPEGQTPNLVVTANHTVAALAQSTDRTFQFRAIRWDEDGRPQSFTGLDVMTAPGYGRNKSGNQDPNYRVESAGVASAGRQIFVTASTNWSGAYSGTSYEVQRWGLYSAARWPLPSCVDSGSSEDQHAYGGDSDGRVAITIDRTGAGSFQVMSDSPEIFAPYAYIVRDGACRNLGRAVVQTVRGQWAAGYRGYLNAKLAPDNLNTLVQRFVAVRWYGTRLRELGPGDALAINHNGLTAGADAVPARKECETTNFYSTDRTGHTYCSGIPHAFVWDANGRRIAIAPDSPRSVAYGVNDAGTVVGMLTGRNGRHFAFRWRNGLLQRLDDLPHPPGWRFESAYAVGNDGTIAGIGTLFNVPTVFIWQQ